MEFKFSFKRPNLFFANPEDIDYFKAYFGYPKKVEFIPLKGFRRYEAKFIGAKEAYHLVPMLCLPTK